MTETKGVRPVLSKEIREQVQKVPIEILQLDLYRKGGKYRTICKPCYFADRNETTEIIFYSEGLVKDLKDKDSLSAIAKKMKYARKLIFQIPLPGNRFKDVTVNNINGHIINATIN